ALLAPCLVAGASTQTAPPTGVIEGTIRSAGEHRPLADVLILIDGTVRGTLSDADGRFRLADVPAGEWTLLARRIGLESLRRSVTVRTGQLTHVELQLRE